MRTSVTNALFGILPEIFIAESLTVSPTFASPYNNGQHGLMTSFFIGSKTFVYI